MLKRKSWIRARVLALSMSLCAGVISSLLACAQIVSVPRPVSPLSRDAELPFAFDVVSVELNKSAGALRYASREADGFKFRNATLTMLVSMAYNVKPDFVSGVPQWATLSAFDIQAKVAPRYVAAWNSASEEQQDTLLRRLLAERIGLRVHGESKVLPIYELVIAKEGSKLRPSALHCTSKARSSYSVGPGMFTGTAIQMSVLVDQLQYRLHKMIIDKTGLTDCYDVALTWDPNDSQDGLSTVERKPDSGRSIFIALQQQLGVTLLANNAAVAMLVIDQAQAPETD